MTAMSSRILIRSRPSSWRGRGRGRATGVGAALVQLSALACGYHLAGHTSALPGIQTIGIPTFVNRTSRPELEQRITEHVIDEFTTRGRARIVPGEEGAQAILKGTILSYTLNPVAINELGRATRYEILITAHVILSEVATDRTIWEDDHFLFKKQYDVAASPQSFVDQEIVAIDDVATDFAKGVVTSILEGF